MASEVVVVFHGLNELNDALITSVASANAANRKIVERGSLVMLSEAKKKFRPSPGGQRTSQKTGKTWYSFQPPYQAVPPQPTSRSGALQSSLGSYHRIKPVGRDGWLAVFGTNKDYASAVEYGTEFMKAEPYMSTGVKSSETRVNAIAAEEWEKVVGVL